MTNKHYYEVNFYGEGHEMNYPFYIKSIEELDNEKIVLKLENEFVRVGLLKQHHVENIVNFREITAREFSLSCGIPL